MTDRIYRTLLGLAILMSLYFESPAAMYSLVAMLVLEGLTRFTVPRLVGAVGNSLGVQSLVYRAEPCNPAFHFNFESEALWRVMVALVLGLTYSFYEYLWFFPWFMGFVIFGAGLSGICPMLMLVRWLGFK